jgi:hypothetical protein
MKCQVTKKWRTTSLSGLHPLVQSTSIQEFLLILHHEEKLKAREAFTVPFRFLCDYADQSDQHMPFIEMRLEILKDDIAAFHEKSQQVPEHSKGEKLSGLGSCSVPLKKTRTWARGKSHKDG